MAKINTGTLQDFLSGTGIGFDRIWDIMDTAGNMTVGTYPPYNIAHVADGIYVIELAVAGFDESTLKITVMSNSLVVQGTRVEDDSSDVNYIHRGLAMRPFTRKFPLADNVEVTGAELKNGILRVYTKVNIPDSNKPQTVKINTV